MPSGDALITENWGEVVEMNFHSQLNLRCIFQNMNCIKGQKITGQSFPEWRKITRASTKKVNTGSLSRIR